MKKRFAIFALAGLVALTSCGSSAGVVKTVTKSSSTGVDKEYQYTNWTAEQKAAFTQGTVNVIVSYNGKAGPTYRQANPYKSVDGVIYSKGDLLPTWKFFSNELKVTVNDICDYSSNSDDKNYAQYVTNAGAGSEFTVNGTKADLWSNSTANIQKAAALGLLEPLDDHLADMPHFKEWLECNPTTAEQLKINGKIYFSPYFDGKDSIEKMFMMNTEYVEKLLNDTYDTATFDTSNTITTAYTTPYIASMNKEKILVTDSTDGSLKEIQVTFKESVISLMEKVKVKNGANLRKCLKDYLVSTYGAYVGKGKIFENYSDIFTSASACYNADELIALMRVVRTNSAYLTGQTAALIETFAPRSGEANRQRNVFELEQIFGIRGTSSEKDRLYFDKDGNLVDGRTQEDTYDGIEKLHALYQEGLILKNYNEGYGSACKGLYSQNLMKDGLEFMCYDYSATTVCYDSNTLDGSKTKEMSPILPPVANWDDGDTTYNYTRFSEDNRALKSGGWAIIKGSANMAAACRMMDFTFTEEGAYAQDFGPKSINGTATNLWTETATLVDGTVCPKISDKVLAAISASTDTVNGGSGNTNAAAGNWNNWYRYYVGATIGIGHIRSNGLDYQVNNASGQSGLNKIKAAISAGSMVLAKTTGTNGFAKSVQTNWDLSTTVSDQIKTDTKGIIALYSETNPSSGVGNVQPFTGYIMYGFGNEGNLTRAEITAMFATTNTVYLANMKNAVL